MYKIKLLNTSSLSVIIFSYCFFPLFKRVIGVSKIATIYLPNYMFLGLFYCHYRL